MPSSHRSNAVLPNHISRRRASIGDIVYEAGVIERNTRMLHLRIMYRSRTPTGSNEQETYETEVLSALGSL